jgi:hypothetical protein
MNSGQMMLAAGAMILMGTTVLTVNRNSLNNGTILRQTELGIYGVSLATSFIQHATSMAFDELVVIRPVLPVSPTPATYLTTSANLGREYTHLHTAVANQDPKEILNRPSSFDDIDDYKNFVVDTAIASVDIFHVTADVYYVSATPPYALTTTPTWLKRIDFKVNNTISRKAFENTSVTNRQGTDTIRMSYIRSYY